MNQSLTEVALGCLAQAAILGLLALVAFTALGIHERMERRQLEAAKRKAEELRVRQPLRLAPFDAAKAQRDEVERVLRIIRGDAS